MAFALEHAKHHGMRRVIYVIPFTSIIPSKTPPSSAKRFGDLGEAAVLEHHSTFDDSKLKDQHSKDKLRQASENWDMPVVVTTAVQFFESLFADRSSRCRKLHNIAGSVIILDEAQMLPLNLLLPVMQAIKELARSYRCSSVVMCTATQPAVQAEHGTFTAALKTCAKLPRIRPHFSNNCAEPAYNISACKPMPICWKSSGNTGKCSSSSTTAAPAACMTAPNSLTACSTSPL